MQSLAERLQTVPADVAAILRAIFLPKRYGNDFRLASEGAGQKSAAANMSVNYNSNDWDSATVDGLIPATDLLCFLFANPLRSFILYDHNYAEQTYSYDLIDPRTNTTTFLIAPYTKIPTWCRYATPNTAYQPHGPYLFPGYDEGGRLYLWCNQAYNEDDGIPLGLEITLNAPSTFNSGVIVQYYAWDGKHPRLLQTTLVAATQTVIYLDHTNLPAGGAYIYATVHNEQYVNPVSFSARMIGMSGVWGHHPVSNIETLIQQSFGIRVNSCSLRVQNDASPLSRNGNTIAVTVSKSLPWCNFATGSSALSQLQNYREFTADKGYYGLPLPDSDDDISEFYDDVSASSFRNSTWTCTSYPLSERRPYKAVGFNIPVAAGRALTFDVTHTIEYLTNNKLQELKLSTTSEKSVAAALVVASTQETDYTNIPNWQSALETVAGYMQTNDVAEQVALASTAEYRR